MDDARSAEDDNNTTLLRTVIEAAVAVVSPHTESRIRADASRYLQDHVVSEAPTSWTIFALWTRAPQPIEVRLLNLQLLQSKIRKQLRYQSLMFPCLEEIRNTLEELAVSAVAANDASKAAAYPAAICLASICVRTNPVLELVESLLRVRSPVSLLILGNVPDELQSVSELTTSAVAEELQKCCHPLLTYVQEAAAVSILHKWVDIARITISQIAHFPDLLEGLLSMLGSDTSNHNKAAEILQAALTVRSDSGTPTRMAACQRILESISTWNYTESDRGKLLATFTTEEIGTLISLPSPDLLSALLTLQRHPDISVRSAILECWLTASERAMDQRHENWRHPLFHQVAVALLETVCLDEDEDDRAEYQRLCGDVLIDCYVALRLDFLEVMVANASSSSGQRVVPSLVCLNAASKEINGRVKSRFAKDSGQTAELMRRIVPWLDHNVESAKFIGAFAPTWAIKCTKDEILHMLASLARLISAKDENVTLEASKSIKMLLINASDKLNGDPAALPHLQTMLRATLASHNEQALADVTEGCVRTEFDIVEIVKPIVEMAEIWLEATNDVHAIDHLASCLNALTVTLRFSHEPAATKKCYDCLAPFLQNVSNTYGTVDCILEKLLNIERQVFGLAPAVEALVHFQSTVAYVLDAFVARHQPICLNFIGTAAESIPDHEDMFREPIARLSDSFVIMLQRHGPTEKAATVEAFYDMIQRCLLFVPSAVIASGQWPRIISCAVDCLEACQGERQSTREILNFLTKLFGWKSLPIQDKLQQYPLDQELAKYGARVSKLCIDILMGGTQALWPPCSDCICAIVAGSDPATAHAWLYAPCATFDQKVVVTVLRQLLSLLTTGGPANKSKAKMLLKDFAMIQLGELSPDTLVSYALQ